jgi:glycosyltransferase involved in cell wall biosynthesis
MSDTIVVVPCYNERERLDVVQFTKAVSSSSWLTFLFVDDGSTDGTSDLLDLLTTREPSRFQALRLHQNVGKGEAVRQGILQALKSYPAYVAFWDADLATPLSDIAEFRHLLKANPNLEMVFGARVKLLGRSIERKATKHYLGRLCAAAVSIALRLPIYDSQCGAKMFRVSPEFRELVQQPFRTKWIFDVEILARLIQARKGTMLPRAEHVIYEHPLTEWRDIDGSKVKLWSYARAAYDLFRIYCTYRSL